MAEVVIKQGCDTCKHNYLGPGYEPCGSCGSGFKNWEPYVSIPDFKPLTTDEFRKLIQNAPTAELKAPEKKLYNVKVHLLNPDFEGNGGVDISDVVDSGFKTDGIFYAKKADGTWFMCPTERVHYVQIFPVEKED